MRSIPITLSAVLASLVLAACNDDTTAPSPTATSPSAEVQAAVANSWTIRTDMLTTRSNLAVATVKNAAGQSIVYAIGGTNPNGVPLKTVSAYNLATNTWTFRRALPVALAWTNGAAVINGKIYVSGGFSDYRHANLSYALYVYDPVANTWTRKRDLPTLRDEATDGYAHYGAQGVSGVINGKLYVVTGCFEQFEPWPDPDENCGAGLAPGFFRYNPATDQWVVLPIPFKPVAGAVSPFVGGVIGGKFYVFSGDRYTVAGHMEAYDPATNKWTPRNALGLSRPGAAAAVLGGKLYVIGGRRYNAALDRWDILDKTIAYSPSTNLWTTRASMPSARTNIAATTVLVNGQSRIEVIGGPAPGNNLQYTP